MKFLIRNVSFTNGENGDILITDGVIGSVGFYHGEVDRVLDAHGLTAAPGLIDLHVHLRDPGFEHKEDIASGGVAAAVGGVTTVCCMPNTAPVADSVEVLRYISDKAASVSPVHVLPIAAVSQGQKGEALTDFDALSSAGACAFSDDGVPVGSTELMRNALISAAKLKKPVFSHCEMTDFTAPKNAVDYGLNADIELYTGEAAMAARDIALSLETGAPVHICHVSSADTVAVIRAGKELGAKVTCETCPHYMLLTSETVAVKGANAKMNPQLATQSDRAAIIDGLCDGTIDVIATDHAPHSMSEKAGANPPNGIIGLETLLAGALTTLSERMELTDIVAKITQNPAAILGIEGGMLRSGYPADIVLFDPSERWIYDVERSKSKSRNSPFDATEFVGKVKYTIVNGEIVYNAEEIV